MHVPTMEIAVRHKVETPAVPSELELTNIPCLLSINPQPAFCLDLDKKIYNARTCVSAVYENAVLLRDKGLREKLYAAAIWSGSSVDKFSKWMYKPALECGSNDAVYDYAGMKWTQVTVQHRWRVVCATSDSGPPRHTTLPAEAQKNAQSVEHEDNADANLAGRLEGQSRVAEEIKQRLMAAIDVVPVGVAIGNPDGSIVHANQYWYDIAGFDSDSPFPAGMFYACLSDGYADYLTTVWEQLVTTGEAVSFELQIKTRQDNKRDHVDDRTRLKWILSNCTAEKDSAGVVTFVTTCITDITQQKEAEREVNERVKAAEKLSRRLSHMKRMAETASVAMFDVTAEGVILGANDAFYTLMGLDQYNDTDRVLGMSDWTSAIHEDDLPRAMSNFQRILEGEQIDNILRVKNNPWVHDDGQGNVVTHERYLLNTAIPLKTPGSDEVTISSTLTDISAQKAQERILAERAELLKKLLKTQERFSNFTTNAPIGMSMIDPKGSTFFANDTWNTLIPSADRQDTNPPFLRVVHEDDRAAVRESWTKVSNATEPMALTYSFRLKRIWEGPENTSLTHSWMQASSFPEFDSEGIVQSIMSCVNDISYYKWAEGIQARRTAEALESKRQQENFIDMTSHEIRNPLSAMTILCDVVVDSLNNLNGSPSMKTDAIETALDSMATIISCTQHQKRIIDDILTLSKLDSRLLNITPVPTSAIRVLKEAHKMFETEATRLDIKLSSELDPTVRTLGIDWVLMDPSRTMQVLINLCTNAIKFTQKRSVRKIDMLMSASRERPLSASGDIQYVPNSRSSASEIMEDDLIYLKFAVKDTGTGLTKEETSKLFKRFSQASIKTHTQYGGSGLGLWVSRELTEMSGGEIGVESQSGVGSTFAFYIACKKIAAPESTHIHTLSNGDAKLSTNGTPRSLHIMVVEDNLINQAVLQKQLIKMGCKVTVANHGEQCLSLLQKTQHQRGNEKEGLALDIVLMDMEMPIMDGLTATSRIRDLENIGELIGHIPIIAVSANARAEQIASARSAGVDDVVVKPFRIPELMEKIYLMLDNDQMATT